MSIESTGSSFFFTLLWQRLVKRCGTKGMKDTLFIRHQVNISWPAGRKWCPEILPQSEPGLSGNQQSLRQQITSVCVLRLPDSCSWGISSAAPELFIDVLDSHYVGILWCCGCFDVWASVARGNGAPESRRIVGERCTAATCRSSMIHSFCLPTRRLSKSNRTSCAPFH